METTKTVEEGIEQGYLVGRFLPFAADYMNYCQQTDQPWVYIFPEDGDMAFVGVTLAVNSYRMSLPAWREIRDLLQAHYTGDHFPEFLDGSIDEEFAAIHPVAYAIEHRLARKARVCLEVGSIPLEYAESIAEEIIDILAPGSAREAASRRTS